MLDLAQRCLHSDFNILLIVRSTSHPLLINIDLIITILFLRRSLLDRYRELVRPRLARWIALQSSVRSFLLFVASPFVINTIEYRASHHGRFCASGSKRCDLHRPRSAPFLAVHSRSLLHRVARQPRRVRIHTLNYIDNLVLACSIVKRARIYQHEAARSIHSLCPPRSIRSICV